MRSYTMGLDIGSKSIGWALINSDGEPKIIDIGVRVFPEGVNRDTKGAEQSKNATRRQARGSRRNRWRYQRRREQLVDFLREAELLPKDDRQLAELLNIDPYPLRANGLDEQLQPFEFGRVLYHLNQRRGFKSNRKSGKKDDDGKVKKQATQLQADIESASCRTLGEYMAKLDPEQNRRRNRYTFRSMYEYEFDLLWKKQSEFYPGMLIDELRGKIADYTIFYQRPLKPCDDKIGDCPFEEGEKRCPRDDWYALKYRLLQDVNNLRYEMDDGRDIPLDEPQRDKLIGSLEQRKEMTFNQIRKLLGLLDWQRFNFEEETGRKKLKGNAFGAGFKSILKAKNWAGVSAEKRIELNSAMLEMEDDQLSEYLIAEFGLTEKQLEKVYKINMPTGYMAYSRTAIKKLLEHMEKGALQHEAVKYVYSSKDKEIKESPEQEKLGLPDDTRNPLVNKALFEVRKLVNAIIVGYGKPQRIKVEMARDVKGSLRERKEIYFKQLDNKKYNEQVRQKLINEYNVPRPSYDDIIKYKLWEECGLVCPYTGKSIAGHQLFVEHPEFQIEHILPYSRSLDDSFYNKTLCWVEENRRKDNKTPFEFYQGTPQYENIKQRIRHFPKPKREKFFQQEIDLKENISRELNDTRYITREVVRYLRKLGCIVKGTKGKITSELRHSWGLNNILDFNGTGIKNREDHRHHAIDAAVVAVTKNDHLHTLAATKYATGDNSFPQPWHDFRDELEKRVSKIIVSHRPSRRIRGRLHEETAYGPTGQKDDKGQDIFVYRRKLEDLTGAMVNDIVDEQVRRIVKQRLSQFDIECKGSKAMSKEVWQEPLYMKCNKKDDNGNVKKIPIKKVRIKTVAGNMILLDDSEGKPYRAVKPGGNHHVEIFEYTDKKGNVKKDGRIVTLFEAVQRKKNGEPIIKKDCGDGRKFLYSLAQNEMFMLNESDDASILTRVQKLAQSGNSISIALRPHTYAGQVKNADVPPLIFRKSPNTLKGCKVHVDRLGRVYPAND